MRRAAEPAEKDLKASIAWWWWWCVCIMNIFPFCLLSRIIFLSCVLFLHCVFVCECSLNFILLVLILLLLLLLFVLMNVSGTRDDILMDLSTPLSFDFPRANDFFFAGLVQFGFFHFRPLVPSFSVGFFFFCYVLFWLLTRSTFYVYIHKYTKLDVTKQMNDFFL